VLAYLDPDSGSSGLGIIFFLILLAIYFMPAILVAKFAANKGHNFWLFVLIGLLLSWVIELIVALIVEDKTKPRPVVVEQGPDDHLDRLKKLTEMREARTLSAEEFETEEARILSERS
jgi:hypothetical protein